MAPPPTSSVTRPSPGSHYAPVLALSERAGSSIPVLLNRNSGHHGTGRRQGGADWALLGRYSLAHLSRPRIDPRRPLVPLVPDPDGESTCWLLSTNHSDASVLVFLFYFFFVFLFAHTYHLCLWTDWAAPPSGSESKKALFGNCRKPITQMFKVYSYISLTEVSL